jgi:hypothetical protein
MSMADGNDRSTFADEVERGHIDRDAADYDAPPIGEAQPLDPDTEDLDPDTEDLVDRALDRLGRLTAREAAERITDDVVALRLQQVRQGRTAWFEDPYGDSDELAGPMYGIVRIWIQLLMAIEPRSIGLDEHSIDEIATETVAQAMNKFVQGLQLQDSTGRKVAFLAVCAARLPHAYLGWQLRAGRHEFNDLHELDQLSANAESLLGGLHRCVHDRRAAAADILRSWGHDDPESDEIIAVTRDAVRLAHETTG